MSTETNNLNDQAMKRGREEEEDRENKRCKPPTIEDTVQKVLEFVSEHSDEFAAAARVEEALYSSFLKKIKKLVSKRTLTRPTGPVYRCSSPSFHCSDEF